jgi:cell pole-organizing protein PopZ
LATLAPKLRGLLGVAAGASVASILVGPAGLLLGGALAAAALGVVNTALETALWARRSKRDRDAYINSAMIEGDTRTLIKRAASRVDSLPTDPLARRRGIARLYFNDFIAVGPQAALRSLPDDEKIAFGVAYLDGMGNNRPESACISAGNSAVAVVKAAKVKAAQAAAKANAIATAKVRAKAEMEAAARQVASAKTPVQQQTARAAVATATSKVNAVIADEAAVKKEIVQAQQEVAAPTSSEVASAKEEAPVAETEVNKGVVPPPSQKAPASSGGGFLPVLAVGVALVAGAPALPVLAVGAGLALLLGKKKPETVPVGHWG